MRKLFSLKRILILLVPLFIIGYIFLIKFPYSEKEKISNFLILQNIPPGWNFKKQIVTEININGVYFKDLKDVTNESSGNIFLLESIGYSTIRLLFISNNTPAKLFTIITSVAPKDVDKVFVQDNNLFERKREKIIVNQSSYPGFVFIYLFIYLFICGVSFVGKDLAEKEKAKKVK